MQIELTKVEAETLLQLLDVAVKALGLQGAQVAMPIVSKITSAAQVEAAPAKEDDDV